MDFRRVEAIFIMVFLSLNLFLFYIYQEGKVDQAMLSTSSISANLENRFQMDRITYEVSLSDDKQEGYYLVAEEVRLYEEAKKTLYNQAWQVTDTRLSSQLNEQRDIIVTKKNALEVLKKNLEDPSTILHGSEYTLNENETIPLNKYVYYQTYEGAPFLDDTSSLVINVIESEEEYGEVSDYVQTYIHDIEPLRDPQPLVSEREAVTSLYTNNRLQTGDHIQWSNVGYIHIFTIRGKNVYIPAWIISVENSKGVVRTEKINAFTGAVITSNISGRDN